MFLLWAAEYKGRKEAIEFCIFAAMNIEAYREYCLSLGNVVEKLPLVCGRKTRKVILLALVLIYIVTILQDARYYAKIDPKH